MGIIKAIPLTDEQAGEAARLVDAGICHDASDIFTAGLRVLAEDAALERLVSEQVDPFVDATPGIPAAEVFAALRALHARRFGKN